MTGAFNTCESSNSSGDRSASLDPPPAQMRGLLAWAKAFAADLTSAGSGLLFGCTSCSNSSISVWLGSMSQGTSISTGLGRPVVSCSMAR